MSDYAEFFLGSKTNVVQLELIEISHPAFTQTYRMVRNAVLGVEVTLETNEDAFFEYRPVRLSPSGSRDNLDQSIRIDVGDLGELLPKEFDAVASSEAGFSIKPKVLYRTYRSDDLTAPLFGPLEFEVTTFSFKEMGASFEAEAPKLSLLGTGEIYTFARWPMLRGFL